MTALVVRYKDITIKTLRESYEHLKIFFPPTCLMIRRPELPEISHAMTLTWAVQAPSIALVFSFYIRLMWQIQATLLRFQLPIVFQPPLKLGQSQCAGGEIACFRPAHP